MLKASSDERELTSIEKRLAQMSQRATFQILVCYVVLLKTNAGFHFKYICVLLWTSVPYLLI